MKRRYYRGRLVNFSKPYPRIYWPEHPTSQSGGMCTVHRIVGYEMWGEEVFGNHVHHKDHDKENWSPENLELLTPLEHKKIHGGAFEPTELKCKQCGDTFEVTDELHRKYCSQPCVRKSLERIDWPEVKYLLERSGEIGFSALGRELGVSCNAIRKRIKNHGE